MDLMDILSGDAPYSIGRDEVGLQPAAVNEMQDSDMVFHLPTPMTVFQMDLSEVIVQLFYGEITLAVFENSSHKRTSIDSLLDSNPGPHFAGRQNHEKMNILFNQLKIVSKHPSLLVDHFIPKKLLLLEVVERLINMSGKFQLFNRLIDSLIDADKKYNLLVVAESVKELELIEGLILGKTLWYQNLSRSKLYEEDEPTEQERLKLKLTVYLITTQVLYNKYTSTTESDVQPNAIFTFDSSLNIKSPSIELLRMRSKVPILIPTPLFSIEHIIVDRPEPEMKMLSLHSHDVASHIFKWQFEVLKIFIMRRSFYYENNLENFFVENYEPKMKSLVEWLYSYESTLFPLRHVQKKYDTIMNSPFSDEDFSHALDQNFIPKSVTHQASPIDYKLFRSRFAEVLHDRVNYIYRELDGNLSQKLRTFRDCETKRQLDYDADEDRIAEVYRKLRKSNDELALVERKLVRVETDATKYSTKRKEVEAKLKVLHEIKDRLTRYEGTRDEAKKVEADVENVLSLQEEKDDNANYFNGDKEIKSSIPESLTSKDKNVIKEEKNEEETEIASNNNVSVKIELKTELQDSEMLDEIETKSTIHQLEVSNNTSELDIKSKDYGSEISNQIDTKNTNSDPQVESYEEEKKLLSPEEITSTTETEALKFESESKNGSHIQGENAKEPKAIFNGVDTELTTDSSPKSQIEENPAIVNPAIDVESAKVSDIKNELETDDITNVTEKDEMDTVMTEPSIVAECSRAEDKDTDIQMEDALEQTVIVPENVTVVKDKDNKETEQEDGQLNRDGVNSAVSTSGVEEEEVSIMKDDSETREAEIPAKTTINDVAEDSQTDGVVKMDIEEEKISEGVKEGSLENSAELEATADEQSEKNSVQPLIETASTVVDEKELVTDSEIDQQEKLIEELTRKCLEAKQELNTLEEVTEALRTEYQVQSSEAVLCSRQLENLIKKNDDIQQSVTRPGLKILPTLRGKESILTTEIQLDKLQRENRFMLLFINEKLEGLVKQRVAIVDSTSSSTNSRLSRGVSRSSTPF